MAVREPLLHRLPTGSARYVDGLGKEIATGNDAFRTVAFSPDGRTLAAPSDDHTIHLWDMANRRDSYPATSQSSGTISLWTPPAGLVPNYFGRINAPAFNADGLVVATASDKRDSTMVQSEPIDARRNITLAGKPA